MPKFYDSISDSLKDWILQQPIFFTASAPTVGKHINVSPKGLPNTTFTILNPNKVAYLDYTGSGAETIAHIYDNGRVTIMLNSFGPSPRICRLFCKGSVVEAEDKNFESMFAQMQKGEVPPGVRAIIVLDVWKVQTSCGYGVPILKGEWENRDTMDNWAMKMTKDPEKILEYQAEWNSFSLDGCPSMKSARKRKGVSVVTAEVKRAASRWEANWDSVAVGLLFGIVAGVALTKRLPSF